MVSAVSRDDMLPCAGHVKVPNLLPKDLREQRGSQPSHDAVLHEREEEDVPEVQRGVDPTMMRRAPGRFSASERLSRCTSRWRET